MAHGNQLHRATSTTQYETRDRDGAFGRIRRSISGGKEKYKQLYFKSQSEIKDLERERDELLKRLQTIANGSSYHATNLQIGDHNTIECNKEIDASLQEIQDLICTLTGAIDSVVEEKTIVESELETLKVMQEETQEAFSNYIQMYENKTRDDEKCFKEQKGLLLEIRSNHLPDRQVMEECIDSLRGHVVTKNKLVSDYGSLPDKVKPGLNRLLLRARKMTAQELMDHLGLKPSGEEQLSKTGMVGNSLNKDTCGKILMEWVKDLNNTTDMFMKRIDAIETKRTEEAKRVYKGSLERKWKHISKSRQDISSSANLAYSIESLAPPTARCPLGDRSTQTTNEDEPVIRVLNAVEVMQPQIDTMHDWVSKEISRYQSMEKILRVMSRLGCKHCMARL